MVRHKRHVSPAIPFLVGVTAGGVLGPIIYNRLYGWKPVVEHGWQPAPQQGWGWEPAPQKGWEPAPQQGWEPAPQQGWAPAPQKGWQLILPRLTFHHLIKVQKYSTKPQSKKKLYNQLSNYAWPVSLPTA